MVQSRKYLQHLISIGSVLIISFICFLASPVLEYKTIALLLLVTVSINAMLFDITPVFLSAILSALIWNFFFIPPVLTFHIGNTEDLLMFCLYFFIASVNVVLTIKIRKQSEKARDKEEKENTIKLYNTLLNSLSHELRTPIATIIGSVDVLKENKNKISELNENELLNQIATASLKLNTHVENLLNMSRLESGELKLNKDWCDCNEIINNVIQNLIIPHKQDIIFNSDENLPFFKLDRILIEQALQNLINNAILYTPESSTIQIKLELKLEKCILSIVDNGEYISNTDTTQLFDKFYRGKATKTGGLGIGLSIVKGFVEAHQGEIKLYNNPTGGISVIIELPADQSFINHLKHE